uniref:Uncharacterized protein n=1 Tax=Parascaris univalens TaxID=6257 RepID=A0A915B981_PARUN
TLACLIVPPFGIYLMLKSPDQKKHKLPNRIYWAVAKSKSWLRVDVTICLTMSVVFFGFAIILFYGFFKLLPENVYLLFAGIGSLLVSSLYLINAFVSIGQLRCGTIDFAPTMVTHRMSLPKVDNSHTNVDHMNAIDTNRSIDDPTSVNYRSNNLLMKTTENYPYEKFNTNTSTSSRVANSLADQPEIDQRIIDYITEQLDESLEREYSNARYIDSTEISKKYRYAPTRILGTNKSQHVATGQSNSIGSLSENARRTTSSVDAFPHLPALPMRPPPILNSADEVHRIAQFNEGFVASEGSTPLTNSTPVDRDRRVMHEHTTDASSSQRCLNAEDSKNLNECNGIAPAPIGQRSRRFTTKSNDSSSARRRFSRGEENTLRASRTDKSSDEDTTSGFFPEMLLKTQMCSRPEALG